MDLEFLLKKITALEAKVASLEDENSGLKAKVAILEKENFELKEKVKDLESKLAARDKDSHNSSNPPSQDPPEKKKNKYPDKKQSDRKPGGQRGHEGIARKLDPNPDEIIEHEPSHCLTCGESLENVTGTVIERRQELDIPKVRPITREHRLIEKICSCGCKNQGKFPNHIRSIIQFGINVISTLIYLNVVHHIPFQRTTKIFSEIFGLNISEGSVDNILEYAKDKASPHYEFIKKQIRRSKWVGSDETGINVSGKQWWRWVWQNLKFTLFLAVPSRAYKVVLDIFGEDFVGTLIHDCYAAQNKTKAGNHQLCLPHIIRDLIYCIEIEKSLWAYEIMVLLIKAIKADRIMWGEGFCEEQREKIREYYDKQLEKLLCGAPVQIEELKLWKRFTDHQEKIFTFLKFEDVPSNNNGSERAIRNAKIHRKISGCFRSELAPQRHSVLLSVLETAKKQGFAMLDACRLMITQELVLQEAA